jgi:hypothetical protein
MQVNSSKRQDVSTAPEAGIAHEFVCFVAITDNTSLDPQKLRLHNMAIAMPYSPAA